MVDTTIAVGIIVLNMLVLAAIAWASVRFVSSALDVESHDENDQEHENTA